MLVIFCAAYNSFVIPFEVSFKPLVGKTVFFRILDFLIDSIFFVDIIVTFRCVILDERGREITDSKIIALSYLKGMFWVDMSATLPVDTIMQTFPE